MTEAALRLRGVERRFRGGRGVGPIDLDVAPAGRLALLGPSGCGKSTLLRVIAGFERAGRGTIEIAGRSVDRVPLGRRDLSLIEQHLPLYEHLAGHENVAMAISGLKIDRRDRASRIEQAIETAEAGDLVHRRADTLSGGERARICLARVLARRPAVALLDEPFNGLDPDRRGRIRDLALRTLSDAGVAVILVTHDDRDLEGFETRLHLDDDGHMT